MDKSVYEGKQLLHFAEELCDELWLVVGDWSCFDKSTLGRRLIRAADSIGANLAEGYGRCGYVRRKRFMVITRGSLFETRYWIRRARQRELLSSGDVERFERRINLMLPLISSYGNFLSGRNGADQAIG